MAYDSLKNIIRQYIKTNGEQEITGQIMQNVLIEMVNQYPSTEGFIRANLSNLANGDILIYDSVGAWYNTPLSSFFNGYATQLWVNQQGYVTSSALAGYIHPTITDLANGDILIWDSVGAWVNAPLDTTISGFGYVKSTGSVAYATSAGSANILGHSVYENPAHSLANGDMLVYDSGTGWTNVETSSILSGYATQSWVTSQGYITASALNGYATQSWVTSQGYIQPTLSNLSNGDILVYDSGVNWVNTPISSFFNGYATETWVGQQGYITASALNGYATQSWVTSQGYLTSSALNGYIHPTLTNLANGDILIYDSVGTWTNTSLASFNYATQSWVNTQLAGYLPLTGGTMTGKIYNFENRIIQWTSDEGDNNSWGTSWYGLGRYFETQGSLYVGVLAISNYWGINLIAKSNSSVFVNGNAIISSANIGFQSVSYATSAGSANILGHTVYENQAHSLANGDMLVYDSGTGWTNVETSSILSGYATQSWVNQQGFLTSSALNGYIHPTLTNLANGDVLIYDSVGSWVNEPLDTTIAGFGYITSSASITGNASTATKLQTARTIWGQSFDGTGNVDGTISVNVNSTSATYLFHGVNSYNGGATHGIFIEAPNLPTSQTHCPITFGKEASTNNRGNLTFYYAGSGSTSNFVGIGFHANDNKLVVTASGNVGIGTTSPSYKLDVNGSANATTLYENGSRVITTANIGSQSVNYATSAGSANILGHSVTLNSAHSLSNGDILVYDSVGSWTNVSSGLSDIRQKDVINYNAEPTFEAVANAPAIKFTYKDNTYSFRRGVHIGSIAQYWQTTLPETVSMDNDGMLSMQYDVIALLSTISVAKKVSEHERRIVILERENEELRKELAALKSA